jgi:hypothetical protein
MEYSQLINKIKWKNIIGEFFHPQNQDLHADFASDNQLEGWIEYLIL